MNSLRKKLSLFINIVLFITIAFTIQSFNKVYAATQPNNNPTTLALIKSYVPLKMGETDTLYAYLTNPGNQENYSINDAVIWTSSDNNVATVNHGVVTAIKGGTATITANLGNRMVNCIVYVQDSTINTESIKLNKTSDNLLVGETDNLTATVLPDNATNKNVIWSSSDSNIVTVENGFIKGINYGTATITVTTEDGNITTECVVNVDYAVTFKDKNLELAIRNKISKSIGDIYKSEVINITQLDASNYGILYLDGIDNLDNLQFLQLSNNQITDLNPLSGLKYLQNLDLSKNQISNISVLNNSISLKKVDLSDNQILDINALSGLTNLQWLLLSRNQISDINALSNLVNLQVLNLNNNLVTDINSLCNLINLQQLQLSNNQIIDINALKNLYELQILWLSNNQITDITPLSGLTKLNLLDLSGNKVLDITASNNLLNLLQLGLDNNNISNIDTLKNLTNLQTLYLSNNQVTNIDSLKELTNLQALYIYNNPIDVTDEQSLETALPNCNIYF